MRIDQRAFTPTTFSKNRERLLNEVIAKEFFAEVLSRARLRRYLSSEHFSVDGTLLKAWASHKSFKPKPGNDQPGGGPNSGDPDSASPDAGGPDAGGGEAGGPGSGTVEGRNVERDWKSLSSLLCK